MIFQKVQNNISAPQVIEGLPPAGLAYLLAKDRPKAPVVVVCASDKKAEEAETLFRAFGIVDVALFSSHRHTPYEDISPDSLVTAQHFATRSRIEQGIRPQILVVSAQALMGRWLSCADFSKAGFELRVAEEISREEIAARLVACGYQNVSLVEDEGTFAIRGSVVDFYPPLQDHPFRIDLFGDEIASIDYFAAATQRKRGKKESVRVYPIREVLFKEEGIQRATDYLQKYAEDVEIPSRRISTLIEEIKQKHYFFGIESLWPIFNAETDSVAQTLLGDETILVLQEPDEIKETIKSWYEQLAATRQDALESHRVALPLESHAINPEELVQLLEERKSVEVVTLALSKTDSDSETIEETQKPLHFAFEDFVVLAQKIKARREDSSQGEILDPLVAEIRSRLEKGYDLWIAAQSRGAAERLAELLRARKLDLPIYSAMPDVGAIKRPRAAIVVAPLEFGLADRDAKLAILSDVELLGAEIKRGRKSRRQSKVEGLSTLKGLGEGDLIIHVDHGIGRYLGLKRLILDGVDGDYAHLEYAGGDKLYLPVYLLNLLQRFRGPQKGVRLDKLGGNRWERAKQRVKDAVLSMAHGLLAVQARRKLSQGFGLPEPDDHFRAFEATFPYDETPDQARAINEVLEDLQQPQPMDRLVCGDVGFGKTEVALRAAFLAVSGGKQVAILVPTTVLAEQHGVTFRERLSSEPVNIEVLSRFRSPKETRRIIESTREGGVDILIGTHRLLSADINFKNLGLLVVDEEQRFGVKNKERIKELKAQVHVLTLSATPIPRTLHMSVVGLRDLSIIQTPPTERTAIRTEVLRFDEKVIQKAIQRELRRGGQVFVVHNRIRSIGAMAEIIRRLVPEARVVVAHGQMGGEKLERIMVDFVRREHNVLVSTAIIESGIDIPAANTMIVNRADRFGLSQLHQLRGRIGRGRERAYAYLLLPRSDRVTKGATERLSVLKRFSDLGSGFQIASQDLDIRGAGDLLGPSQSGNVATVGFELYTELLNEAVETAKGQVSRVQIEPDIKLPVAAVIPENYITEPVNRLNYYQKMAQAVEDEAIWDVLSEIEDRYGRAPEAVHHLGGVMVIRRRLQRLGVSALSVANANGQLKMGLSFVLKPPIDHEDLTTKLQKESQHYRLLPSGKLAITVNIPGNITEEETIRKIRDELSLLKVAY